MNMEPFGSAGQYIAIANGIVLLLGLLWIVVVRSRRLSLNQLVVVTLHIFVTLVAVLFCSGYINGDETVALLALPAVVVTFVGVYLASRGAHHLAQASIAVYSFVIVASWYHVMWTVFGVDWTDISHGPVYVYVIGSQVIGAAAVYIFLNTLGQKQWAPLRAVSLITIGWVVLILIMGVSRFMPSREFNIVFFVALIAATIGALWLCAFQSPRIPERTNKSARNPKLQWIVGLSLLGAVTSIISYRTSEPTDWSLHTTQAFMIMITAAVALNIGMIELRMLLHQVQASESRFEALFRRAPMSLALISHNGQIVEANPATSELLGWDIHDFVSNRSSDFLSPELAAREAILREDLLAERIDSFKSEMWVPHRDGSARLIRSKTVNLSSSNPEVAFLATIEDATDRYVAQNRLQHLITHDPITGLANREHFLENITITLETQLDRGAIGIVVLTTRGLQSFNDSFGSGSMDRIVLELAARLEQTVGDTGLVGRLDSDRFAVLLYPSKIERHVETARTLGAVTRRSYSVVGSMDFYLEVGVGLVLESHDADADSLLGEASAAAQRALTNGIQHPELGMPKDRIDIRRRHQLVSDLHNAVDQGQFKVLYQPIVSLETGRMQGVEALIRWMHPENGVISPEEFLPYAEAAGMIPDIGRFVLETAVQNVTEWNRTIFMPHGEELCLSVNTGPQQYHQEFFAHEVSSTLDKHGFRPESLCLEITETMLMSEHPQVESSVQALHDLGVNFAVDDFGTGYASMEYLNRFPVSELKIDRAFVAGLGTSERDTAMVKVMIDLSHALGLVVVAEGVETATQEAILKQLGAEYMQGYYFSKPLSAEDFVALAHTTFEPAQQNSR